MKVATEAGVWHVRRRWAPRKLGAHTVWARFLDRSRKVRKRTKEVGDLPDAGCSVDIGEGIVVFIGLVVLVLFLIFIGIPFLVALGDLLIVLLFALVGLAGRVLFRRPWTVDAVSPTGEHHEWFVVGWQASSAARAFIADRISATGTVPTDQEVSAAMLAG